VVEYYTVIIYSIIGKMCLLLFMDPMVHSDRIQDVYVSILGFGLYRRYLAYEGQGTGAIWSWYEY